MNYFFLWDGLCISKIFIWQLRLFHKWVNTGSKLASEGTSTVLDHFVSSFPLYYGELFCQLGKCRTPQLLWMWTWLLLLGLFLFEQNETILSFFYCHHLCVKGNFSNVTPENIMYMLKRARLSGAQERKKWKNWIKKEVKQWYSNEMKLFCCV